MRKRRVRGPVVCGPRKHFFPFLLRNMRRSDSLQRQPCAVRGDSPVARDGIPKTERVYSRYKLDRSSDNDLRKEHNHPPGKIDIDNNEDYCEPGPSERLYLEKRGKPLHGKIYKPIE